MLVLVLYRHAMQNAMVAYPDTRKAGELECHVCDAKAACSMPQQHAAWPTRSLPNVEHEVVIANETWRKQTNCPDPSGDSRACQQQISAVSHTVSALSVFAKLPVLGLRASEPSRAERSVKAASEAQISDSVGSPPLGCGGGSKARVLPTVPRTQCKLSTLWFGHVWPRGSLLYSPGEIIDDNSMLFVLRGEARTL